MCPDMGLHVLRLRESLVTLGANVLILPHVSFQMAPQVSSLGKHLFTHMAGVGLLSCVLFNVFFQAVVMEE